MNGKNCAIFKNSGKKKTSRIYINGQKELNANTHLSQISEETERARLLNFILTKYKRL
jgi:hypothetical protein